MRKADPYRTIKYVSQGEITKLLSKITDLRDKTIFTVMYYGGLRASEPGLLTLEDIKLRERTIHVHRLKGSISNIRTMHTNEYLVLNRWMEERGSRKYANCGNVLFPSSLLEPRAIQGNTINKLFHRYAEMARFPKDKCHPHVLKHSIATHLWEADMEIYAIKEYLGHRNIENTVIYTKISPKRMKEASEKAYAKLEVTI